ncbi:hypothetical protein [Shinella sp. HZN7]|nr:hypothetical protein [Shinella sp. HZN7]
MMSRFSTLKAAADLAGLAALRAFGGAEKYVIGAALGVANRQQYHY